MYNDRQKITTNTTSAVYTRTCAVLLTVQFRAKLKKKQILTVQNHIMYKLA